jgi:UDP-N-acetylglucosamine diphosphorylase/glucosamine-1-phosphate N-acetyltransferase
VADLRYGIFTIRERWAAISGLPVYVLPRPYLSGLYEPLPQEEYLLMDASLKDEDDLRAQILSLQPGECLVDESGLIAGRTEKDITSFNHDTAEGYFEKISVFENAIRLQHYRDLLNWNDEQLRRDFLLMFSRTTTAPVAATNQTSQPENIIIEAGAVVEHCIINAATGPVYIGKNATVMEGAMLRGPISIGENATIKMGAKIYGATTVGPYCIAGGEIKNAILQSYSNKAHDGYLGDAIIGSWCNLGAGTSNSNIKNSAGEITIPDAEKNMPVSAGRKLGVVMGDYSRTAINTSINSGTVIGICCNVFGEGLTPKNIPAFTWGIQNNGNYNFEKAIEHINNWKKLKGHALSDVEISVLKHIFERKEN